MKKKKMENVLGQTNNQMQRKQQFWSKIWELKEHNRKTDWINNLKKELQRHKDKYEADIHLKSLRATLKKVPN